MNTLLFDVGNVIVEADQEITHRKLQSYGIPREKAQLFFTNDEYSDFGRGKISGKRFYQALIKKYFGFSLEYQQVKDAHDSHLIQVDQAVVTLLKKLPKNQLAFATNTNAWQTEREKQLIDLRIYSDKIFRSHKMRMLKTDDACFPYIINQLHVEANQITLIDDSLANILKARAFGLQTIQFFSTKQFENELQGRKIIV